jgi:hypothetical protein
MAGDPKTSQNWPTWRTDVALTLDKAFGKESGQKRVYERLALTLDGLFAREGASPTFQKTLTTLGVILRTARSELEIDIEPAAKNGSRYGSLWAMTDPAKTLAGEITLFAKNHNLEISQIREHGNYQQVPFAHLMEWQGLDLVLVYWLPTPDLYFEVGFLIGKLGHDRVFVVSSEEIPPSFSSSPRANLLNWQTAYRQLLEKIGRVFS